MQPGGADSGVGVPQTGGGSAKPLLAVSTSTGGAGTFSFDSPTSATGAQRDSLTSATNVRLNSTLNSTGSLSAADRGIKATPAYASGTRERKGRISLGSPSGDGRASVSGSHGSSSEDYSSLSYGKKNWLLDADNDWSRCLKRNLQMPKWFQRMRPRYRQWLFCFISEIIIAGALALQFSRFRAAMHGLLLSQTTNELRLMDMTYTRKLDQIALTVKGWGQNLEILSVIKGEGAKYNYTSTVVMDVMRTDLKFLSVEYGMLLDKNGRIVIDINTNRTGEHYDPHNIVSHVLAHPQRGQLQIAHTVPFSELEKANIVTYREMYSTLDNNALTHPFDTKDSSLMRYIATPIFTNVNDTGSLVGVFLCGDIINGKTPIPYLTTAAFMSGFSGIYTLSGDGVNWIPSSATVWIPDSKPQIDELYTARYDPVTPDIETRLLKEAAKHPGHTISLLAHGYAWAARTAPVGVWNTTSLPSEVPAGVMVRALYLANDHTFGTLVKRTWYFLAAMLLINVLSVYFAASTFIAPLEEVAANLKARMKAGAAGATKFVVKELASLDLLAGYMCRVAITLTTALVCAIFIALRIKATVMMVVADLTLSELGIEKVSYTIQLDQMSQGVKSLAAMPSFRRLAASQNDTQRLEIVTLLMQLQKEKRSLSFLSMSSKDNTIIASVNANLVGTKSDPGGVAGLTLRNNLAYQITDYMTYDEFMFIKPDYLNKHVLPNIPDSKLNPYLTKVTPLVRWASAPVYAVENTDMTVPDAVLVAGDLVNGQTGICERLLSVTGNGFVAHYTEKPEGGFDMLNSVLIDRETGEAFVDVELPNNDILVRTASVKGAPVLGKAKIKGKNFVIAATRTPVNRYISADGQIPMNMDPVAYVVYGKDKASTKQLEKTQLVWVVCMALLQITMMMLLSYSAYVPFHKLLTILENKGFANANDRPTIRKVIRVYVIEATINLIKDLRSRSFVANVKVYIIAPLKSRLTKLQKKWRHVFGGHKKKNKKAPVTLQRRTVSSTSPTRSMRVAPESPTAADTIRRGSMNSTTASVAAVVGVNPPS